MSTARDLVDTHLAAFNAHDSAALLATLAPDILWSTGRDVLRGIEEVTGIFDDWLWSLRPSLTPTRFVTDGGLVAVEMTERLTVDGEPREFPIATFFHVRNGLLRGVRVYREGTADV